MIIMKMEMIIMFFAEIIMLLLSLWAWQQGGYIYVQ